MQSQISRNHVTKMYVVMAGDRDQHIAVACWLRTPALGSVRDPVSREQGVE